MRAEEFLEILRSAMPSVEELRNYGLAPEEIRGVQTAFRPMPRPKSVEMPLVTGEIGRLVGGYDCKDLQVRGICFDQAITVKPVGYRFGTCEADPLVVTTAGAVVMFDHAVESASPITCAISPGHFLDALAMLVQMTANKDKWKGREAHAAAQCHSAAGHAASMSFYAGLCGSLEG